MFVEQDEKKQGETREDEGMGHADLKYGDSVVFIQHADTGLWLSYVTFETKKRGIGRVEEKKVNILCNCAFSILLQHDLLVCLGVK